MVLANIKEKRLEPLDFVSISPGYLFERKVKCTTLMLQKLCQIRFMYIT